MEHPSEETLKRFACGTASREERRAVVAHLLKGCAACTGKLRSLMEPESVPPQAYQDALERFNQSLLEALETALDSQEALRSILNSLPPAGPDEKRNDEE